jgi:hypothetical protein
MSKKLKLRCPLIYIAGPYRAADGWKLEQNIREAEERMAEVVEEGATAVCPHSMYRYFDRTSTDEYWLEATRTLLSVCDAIWLGEGWMDSDGSCDEREYAKTVGIPILYSTADMCNFVACSG